MSWLASSFLILGVALAAGFAWYERKHPSARVLSLVAALAALAVVGRIAFAAFPNVKPTTDIVLFAGFALGGAPGLMVGSVAALVSNFFFGQGPWTPWQMAAWGLVGLMGAGLARLARGRELGRVPLAIACGLAGVMFGLVMDLFQWTVGEPHTLAAYGAITTTSFGFNVAHVIGNVTFCLLIGPAFIRALRRYRRRFEVRWVTPSPATTALLLPVIALLGLMLVAAPVMAQSPASKGASYLRAAQNNDGGFGGAPGQGSTQLHSGWAALGFSAIGVNPASVSKNGKSIVDYIRSRAGQLDDTGELERTILVLHASGVNPRSFEGRDLTAQLKKRQRSNGSFGTINLTAFGVLALAATGGGSTSKSVKWLEKQANDDGGYGFAAQAASDADDTGAVLQALAAGGRRGSKAAKRAVAYLRSAQHSDGGFGQMKQQPSNAQSTSWAVQGIAASGRSPAKFKKSGKSPLDYLRGLQKSDGSFRYSRSGNQTPVWVTAQAVTALSGKAFPVAAVTSASSSNGRSGGASSGSGSSNSDSGDDEVGRESSDKKREKDKRDDEAASGGGGVSGIPPATGQQTPDPSAETAEGRNTSAPVAADDGTDDKDKGTVIALAVFTAAALLFIGVTWWRRRRDMDDVLPG